METGDYGPSQSGLFEVDALHRVIRDTPKPVIAAIEGFAVAGEISGASSMILEQRPGHRGRSCPARPV